MRKLSKNKQPLAIKIFYHLTDHTTTYLQFIKKICNYNYTPSRNVMRRYCDFGFNGVKLARVTFVNVCCSTEHNTQGRSSLLCEWSRFRDGVSFCARSARMFRAQLSTSSFLRNEMHTASSSSELYSTRDRAEYSYSCSVLLQLFNKSISGPQMHGLGIFQRGPRQRNKCEMSTSSY